MAAGTGLSGKFFIRGARLTIVCDNLISIAGFTVTDISHYHGMVTCRPARGCAGDLCGSDTGDGRASCTSDADTDISGGRAKA